MIDKCLCPRKCNVDRVRVKGFCGTGHIPVVAKAFLHNWEEPCISGTRGSGTVFFSGCNLKCVYCQNYTISQNNFGKEMSLDKLKDVYLKIQDMGAHNINLVNPSHLIPQIAQSIEMASSLKIPVIYNTNGYDTIEGLKYIEGKVDVFLPDLKYCDSEISKKYSGAEDYFEVASKAVVEMYRQVGPPIFDSEGIIKKGLIIRHLILPGHTQDSMKILDFIKEALPEDIFVSLMSQYTPFYKAEEFPELSRRITRKEYGKVQNYFFKLGFENGYVQERSSAESQYIPCFDLEGL